MSTAKIGRIIRHVSETVQHMRRITVIHI